MPSRDFGNNKIYTYAFRKGLPKYLAIMLCKRARRKMQKDVNVWFSVNECKEDPTQMIAELSDIGAPQMKIHLEEISQHRRVSSFNLPKHGLEFVAKQVKSDTGFDIDYAVEYEGDKYKARIEVYGIEKDDFINAMRKFQDEFVFNIPQLLSVIIKEKMTVKIDREDLEIIPCGSHSIVFPRGEKADDFYEEFHTFFQNLNSVTCEFPEEETENILLACREVQVKDVHYYVKKHHVELKGLKEDVELFKSSIPLKLEKIKKERPTTLFRSETPMSIERASPIIGVNFRCDSRASNNTFESLALSEDGEAFNVSFGDQN